MGKRKKRRVAFEMTEENKELMIKKFPINGISGMQRKYFPNYGKGSIREAAARLEIEVGDVHVNGSRGQTGGEWFRCKELESILGDSKDVTALRRFAAQKHPLGSKLRARYIREVNGYKGKVKKTFLYSSLLVDEFMEATSRFDAEEYLQAGWLKLEEAAAYLGYSTKTRFYEKHKLDRCSEEFRKAHAKILKREVMLKDKLGRLRKTTIFEPYSLEEFRKFLHSSERKKRGKTLITYLQK